MVREKENDMTYALTNKLLLETPDAAQLLSLSASTLNKLRVYGGGPAYRKIGKKVLYQYSELTRWVESLPTQRNTSDTHNQP